MSVETATGVPFHNFTISQTWDGQQLSPQSQFHFRLYLEQESGSLIVEIDAPFFNDPKVPSSVPVGSMPGLWDYEVVELFFLGEDDRYLEVELAPSGHYLLLELHGSRNLVREGMCLESFTSEINAGESRWKGKARIPLQYFPAAVKKLNAYAIYGSGPNRTYTALFPADKKDGFTTPDFHRLQYLKSFTIPGLEK